MTDTDEAADAARFDLPQLVKDLRKQVSVLEVDLRARSDEVEEFSTALRTEYNAAFGAKRTAATYEAWRDDRVTQVAAAWILGTVFVRYCEDNGLIELPFIAGPSERLVDAEERHEKFFREHPQLNDRDWLVEAFNHLAGTNLAVAGIFDKRHNPLWEITPTFEAASALLTFWRRRGNDGEIRYDFTGSDTRFLGDLYQDLSEHARKTFALLQTPVFVEKFILDLTLEPAVEEFGLKDLRTIDPACGSGHFLLDIFERLLNKWRKLEPGTDDWELVRRSLRSVHGCDKNSFAVSIARFRLLVAALNSAKLTRLDQAPQFPLNIAVGDSLMHGRGVAGVEDEPCTPHTYTAEDVDEFMQSCDLLGKSSYHVVVGNPPYITVKDKQENANYRKLYDACSGTYALSVPLAQRLFELAIRTSDRERYSGFVGQITSNSFMKREFGKKLIELFFPTVHLTHVIDTSGAYIPGHGTPTVILVGRNHVGRDGPIRVVLGARGEPSQPRDPSKGLVWLAIVKQVRKPGSESEWISVQDVERSRMSTHPWSLGGGGAGDVQMQIEKAGLERLEKIANSGFRAITGLDDVFLVPQDLLRRVKHPGQNYITGVGVRDWGLHMSNVVFPYADNSPRNNPRLRQFLWPYRENLLDRRRFGRKFEEIPGLAWWEFREYYPKRFAGKLIIAFAFVATHNNFALERAGAVANRHAPVIQLNEGANEEDHLALLGVLNSSTACFWLKHVSHDKGSQSGTGGFMRDEWERFYEFTGTKLREFPVPTSLPLIPSQVLEKLARRLTSCEPLVICKSENPVRGRLNVAREDCENTWQRMVAVQEELDWQVYDAYRLLNDSEAAQLTASDVDAVPGVRLGERAFEIVLARKVAAGETETVWFERHSSTPIVKIPRHWPEWYQQIVQARIDIIEKRRDIALIERPECKRRWATVPWEKKEAEALRTWLLDRCEAEGLWFALRDGMKQPRTLTVSQLADQFRDDADMNSVAQVYATDHLGKRDLTMSQVLEQVVADQHVPYLAALRYKDTGLRKREQWEHVWDLQREEDRTGQRLNIPVPPKYANPDFRKASYWSQRGKLDVPKERFISYPDLGPDADPTLLLGWAGWDHKDQAQALVNIINDRTEQTGWGIDRLTPLLAGLREVMPWVHQWHGEYDDAWGGTPAEEYQTFLDDQRTKKQLTEADLRAWRPMTGGRGRRAGKKGDRQ
jgi:hypothetical protein